MLALALLVAGRRRLAAALAVWAGVALVLALRVIIPALNEESTVAGVIRACLADGPLEVLVIDADSQSSLTTSQFGLPDTGLRTVGDVIVDGTPGAA